MNKRIMIDLGSPKTRKNIIICIVGALLLIGGGVYYLMSDQSSNIEEELQASNQTEEELETTEETQELEEQNTSIYVDISGAVKEPSVIVLAEGSRVFDAIEAAGGLNDDANLMSINRAEVLEDGTYLYIPTNKEVKEEASIPSGGSGGTASAGSGTTGSTNSGGAGGAAVSDKININTADSQTLQQLNGVGPATADKIIEYRTNTGKFKNVEDIKNVSGIGDKTFEKLEPHIKV